jgi:hypothetical protein
VIGITSNGQIEKKYTISLGNLGVEKDDIKSSGLISQLSNYAVIDSWQESNNFILIGGVNKRHMFNILYDKEQKKGFNLIYNLNIRDHAFHNDIDGGYPILPRGILSDGSVYEVIEPSNYQYYINTPYNNSIDIKTPYEEPLSYHEMKFDDNPIIMIVHTQ